MCHSGLADGQWDRYLNLWSYGFIAMVLIHTPDWVKHAVFYQIFPDRFARAVPPGGPLPAERVPLEPWNDPPTLQGYKGGNFWGIIEKLDYLQDLGFNAIYFTPIFQSTSNHRYHTHDYYQVDPLLGGNVAFEKLLDACHARDMKVVLDGVFNHASRGFFFFNDILENGSFSPWVDWFQIERWGLSAYDGSLPANYVGWAGNRALPVFNHKNPAVRDYIMQVGEHWIRQGADGWRLDVPFEVKEPGFWQEFRDRIKAVNPEAYIVGEVWENATEWLEGDQFDGVMNYPLTAANIAFVGGDRVVMDLVLDRSYEPYPALTAQSYAEKVYDIFHRHPWDITLTQLNLLDSHDTARLLSIVGGDRPAVELATLLMFTSPGAPCVYYGDEVGLEGWLDPDCRRGFPPENQWDRQVLDYHRQLIALRQQHLCLRLGGYRVLYAEGLVYAFARQHLGETLIIIVNADTDPQTATITLNETMDSISQTILYGSGTVDRQGDTLHVGLEGRQGIVLG